MPEFFDRRDGSSENLPDKFKCPNCGGFIPNNETPGAYMGAISRRDNKTEICSNCGTLEAMADYGLNRLTKNFTTKKDQDLPTDYTGKAFEAFTKDENALNHGAFGWDNPTHYADNEEPNPYDTNIFDEHTNTYECPNCGVSGMDKKESRNHKCEGQE